MTLPREIFDEFALGPGGGETPHMKGVATLVGKF